MNTVLRQFFAMVRRYPLVVFSVVIFLFLSVANYLLWDQQKALVQRHEDVRKNGESMLSALASYSRLTTELAAVQEALQLIDQNLVVEGDLAENLGYFYQLETRSHSRLSQLNQLSSLPPPEGNPYKSIPFSLRVTGTYAQIISFLRELETGPRLLRIRTYTFGRGDLKTNTLNLDLVVELLGSQ